MVDNLTMAKSELWQILWHFLQRKNGVLNFQTVNMQGCAYGMLSLLVLGHVRRFQGLLHPPSSPHPHPAQHWEKATQASSIQGIKAFQALLIEQSNTYKSDKITDLNFGLKKIQTDLRSFFGSQSIRSIWLPKKRKTESAKIKSEI